jgi:hypothetical protein
LFKKKYTPGRWPGHSGSEAQKRPNIVSKETYYSVKPARWPGHSGSEVRGRSDEDALVNSSAAGEGSPGQASATPRSADAPAKTN